MNDPLIERIERLEKLAESQKQTARALEDMYSNQYEIAKELAKASGHLVAMMQHLKSD